MTCYAAQVLSCPTCKRPIPAEPSRPLPFCSQRCKLADLANWLDGRYVVATGEAAPFDESDSTLLSADED
jgi:endogenous inhibitor of DNA gyrase (YacG/DUF329 family)